MTPAQLYTRRYPQYVIDTLSATSAECAVILPLPLPYVIRLIAVMALAVMIGCFGSVSLWLSAKADARGQ